MTAGQLLAVLVAVCVGYAAVAVGAGVWVARRAREQTRPRGSRTSVVVDLDAAALGRLWDDIEALGRPGAGQRRVPQQRRYQPHGPALDLDALIASMEPCGSGVMPTCRLHDETTCRKAGPCCPTCPTTNA